MSNVYLPKGLHAAISTNCPQSETQNFIRKREIVVGRFVDEFSTIEEENGILKDVLAQSGAGNIPIQIIMRSTTVGAAKASKKVSHNAVSSLTIDLSDIT